MGSDGKQAGRLFCHGRPSGCCRYRIHRICEYTYMYRYLHYPENEETLHVHVPVPSYVAQ